MEKKTVNIFTIAVTTFIPWLISLAALGASSTLARPILVASHYTLVVLLFGVAFSIYYKGHKGSDPFTVMGTAMISFICFEVIYYGFVYDGTLWFLNYIDWFLPTFLIATTIYGLGKIFK
jgi:hypothetical protein